MNKFKKGHKKWVSYLHRTATTAYPCYLPVLGIQQELVVQDLPEAKLQNIKGFGLNFRIFKLR